MSFKPNKLGIYYLGGTEAERPQWLVRGRERTVLLQVRDEGLAVYLDEKEAFRWKGDWSKVTQEGPVFGSTEGRIFGLCAYGYDMTYSAIEMRTVTGAEGQKLPPTPKK